MKPTIATSCPTDAARTTARTTSRTNGQEGSAYIVVLLVMFVLTSLGLALTFVTQNEIVIGSQERTIQRAFYAADSGVSLSISDALRGDFDPKEIEVENPTGLFGSDLIDRIETSRFTPILDQPCNLCQINQGNEFYEINHAISARGLRIAQGEDEDSNVPVARRDVTVMVELQPVRRSPQALFANVDPTNTLQVRF
jgi:hypothetical protein